MYRHGEIKLGKHGGQARLWYQEKSHKYQISFLLQQLSDLKQYPPITSSSVGQKFRQAQLGLFRGSQGQNQSVSQAELSSGNS